MFMWQSSNSVLGTAATSNLSTQPTHNNPISTTRPISNPYTQPYAIFHRRPVSKKSLNTKNPRAGTTRRQFPTPGNPLFSTLFRAFISLPVTSILPSRLCFLCATELYHPQNLHKTPEILSLAALRCVRHPAFQDTILSLR